LAESLGTVLTGGMGLLRRWWWPVNPKIVFDQMAAPVSEIIYCSLCQARTTQHFYANVYTVRPTRR
jgi:hypothetical protein